MLTRLAAAKPLVAALAIIVSIAAGTALLSRPAPPATTALGPASAAPTALAAVPTRQIATAAPTTEPTPWPTPPASPTASPSPVPTAQPKPRATPRPATKVASVTRSAPRPASPPKPKATAKAASSVRSITVRSIPALKKALANNRYSLIIVANGTYHVSPASMTHADSLWIGSAYAKRTRAVTVRAATRGRVIFDGGGTSSFGCINFADGAHHQTWDGFKCANGRANNTGVVTFGGYAGHAPPHHITMRNITITASCRGSATATSNPNDHAFYISYAVGGPHDLRFSGITVDGSGGLASAFHFYHSSGANKNAWNVTISGLTVKRTQQAIMLYDPTLRNITVQSARISGALLYAVRYEGGTGIHLNYITSTGSGRAGFHSSKGSKPAGVTFSHDKFQ